jgi:AraC-like DNA-binding protein
VPPPLLILTLEIATLVCAALLAVRVLASRPRLPAAQLIALIAFGVGCGVILGHQEYGPWTPPAFRIDVGGFAPFLNLARNLTPGLFMMLSFTLFTDGRRFPRVLWVLLAVQLLFEEPGRVAIPAAWPHARLATQTAPALLQTLFAGFALYWTLADWRADLIESRRRTRLFTLVVGGLLTLVSGLLTRVLIAPVSPANYAVHVGVTAADLAILSFVLFRLTEGDVGRHLTFEPAPEPRPKAGADHGPALARLRALLEEEMIWGKEGLTLGALAARVGLPEYRLRALIHEELGYRNFNALLHHYRVREACRQLSDPNLKRTPILTIALSVGYASVNTFNRGFREVMGVTPSAWRAGALDGAGGQRQDRQ